MAVVDIEGAEAPDVRNDRGVLGACCRRNIDILSPSSIPGVVTGYGLEEVDGYGKCLVMEWIDGVTLEESGSPSNLIPVLKAVQIAHQLLVVIEYVHDHADCASRPETFQHHD